MVEPQDKGPLGSFLDVPIRDMSFIHELAYTLAAIVGTVFTIPPALVAGEQELAQQSSFRRVQPILLDPLAAIDARRRDLITDASYHETMSRLGYNANTRHTLGQLAKQQLGPADVLDLWRRGVMDAEERDAALARLGWVDNDATGLVQLAAFKPPVQDVIAFAVREVFRPAIRERFQLDAEFPGDDSETGPELMAMFRAVGIDEALAKQYWASHWTLPSLNQAFEMFQRTDETQIDENDIDDLLLAQDVMLKWREPLKAIAYRPITRVDVRRWHAVGMLTDDELTERYKRVGFSPADALKQTEFTKLFNERGEDDALEPFRTPLRSRATGLWRRGMLTDEQLSGIFLDLGFPADQAEAFLTAALFEREADRAQETLRSIKPLFVRGFWTEAETVARLRELGFVEDELRVALDDWTLDKELRAETELERAERDLSKSDVLGAFRDQLINRLDAEEFLRGLGYDDVELTVLLDREELRAGRERRTRIERGARALFMAGRADRDATTTTLAEGEIPTARITMLLIEWQAERDARTPELTTAQVQKAFKLGHIDRVEVTARLDEKGYTIADRDILILLAGSDDGVTEEGV
jgi:hypothetical protein